MGLSDEQRSAMGKAGREHIVATFDLDAVADRWQRIYDQLRKGVRGDERG